MSALASFSDGRVVYSYGKKTYLLHTDRVEVTTSQAGQHFVVSVPLADLREQPDSLRLHSFAFRCGVLLTTTSLVLLLVTGAIFGNYQGKFTHWYLGGALLSIAGMLISAMTFGSIRVIRFNSKTTGEPRLDIVSQQRKNRSRQHAFAEAVQRQIVCAADSARNAPS